MKNKKDRKVKRVKKSPPHWTAFEEAVWGPTRLKALLDRMKDAIHEERCLTIQQFTTEEGIDLSDFKAWSRKHPFFRRGLNILIDLMYAKRWEILETEPERELLRKTLPHYDRWRKQQQEADDQKKTEQQEKMLTFQNQLAKDLATHNHQLKLQQPEDSPLKDLTLIMKNQEGQEVLRLTNENDES